MTFQQFYFVVTANRTWGRALDRNEAIKNACIKPSDKKTEYAIYIGCVKPEATKEQLANIMQCYKVDDFGGVGAYANYDEKDPAKVQEYETDMKMIGDFLAGWVMEKINFKKEVSTS